MHMHRKTIKKIMAYEIKEIQAKNKHLGPWIYPLTRQVHFHSLSTKHDYVKVCICKPINLIRQ